MTSSHLSRQLDRVPFLPDSLVAGTLPRMHLVPDTGDMDTDASAPEIFTERLMQVQLARFWRSFESRQNSEYDTTQGEQRYERFCAEYLPTLPPAFALEPDTKWDKHLPKLAMQRQILHICIFDSICWNFRPLLLLKPSQVASLAPYKQVLLQSQKKALAMAALGELEAVSALHSMFNDSHTRFGVIIFNTFEAAVLLCCLCSHVDFPVEEGENSACVLGLEVGTLTRGKLMRAIEKALGRLQMLAEVSDMAASGARVVAQLFVKALRDMESPEPATPVGSSHSSWWPSTSSGLLGLDWDSGHWASPEYSSPSLMTELPPNTVYEDWYSNLELPSLDFALPYTVGGI